MLMRGKNAGNPDGLPSILTWQKRKLTIENRGSDNFCHPTHIILDFYTSVNNSLSLCCTIFNDVVK